MASKRSYRIDEEEELYSSEDPIDMDSEEEQLPPIKKTQPAKKKRTMEDRNSSKGKQHRAYQKHEVVITPSQKKLSAVHRHTENNLTFSKRLTESVFDFDGISFAQTKDKARQNIIKKKFIPMNLIGFCKKAERINFAKAGSNEEKWEIVFTVGFIVDLLSMGMKRTFEGTEYDFETVDQRIHLPKRFQALFANLEDLSRLTGTLLVRPDYAAEKWTDKNDETKSSVPFILITPSARTLSELKIEPADYPTYDDWRDEIDRVGTNDGQNSKEFSAPYSTLIEKLAKESDAFYKQETHNLNQLK